MKKIPKQYQEAIFDSVDKLAHFPNCQNLDIVALKNGGGPQNLDNVLRCKSL